MSNTDRQVELIRSALSAARSSLRLAEDLLSQLSSRGYSSDSGRGMDRGMDRRDDHRDEKPVVSGIFDGARVKLSDGTEHEVAPNYIAKVPLVYGDTLKVDRLTKEGKAYFKQHKRVRRHKEEGVIAKKDGKWVVVTSIGSHKLSPYAVEELWGAREGDEATVLLPEEEKNAPFAAIESVKGKTPKETRREEEVKKEEPVKAPKKEEKKEEVKEKPKAKEAPKKEEKKEVKKEEKKEEKKETVKPKRVVEDDDLR